MRISDWSSDVCSSDLPKQSCDAVKFILKHSDTKAIFVGPMPDADEFMSAVPEGTIRIGFPYEGVSHCDHQWDDLVRASEPFAGYQPPPPSDTYTLIYTRSEERSAGKRV